jgi:hypothetical protein
MINPDTFPLHSREELSRQPLNRRGRKINGTINFLVVINAAKFLRSGDLLGT